MPALPPVAKVLKIGYGFVISEDLGAFCREFFLYTGGGATAADLDTLAGSIASSYGTNLASLAHPDTVLTSVVIEDLTSDVAPTGIDLTTQAGTRTGGRLPASAAVLESLEIDRRYRGGHPRTFWPFGTDTDLEDDQTWTSGFLTAVADGLNAHFTDWSTDLVAGITSVEAVNVSYYSGFTVHTGTTGRARNVSTPRATPIVDVIVAGIIRVGIAQIRRRLLGLA